MVSDAVLGIVHLEHTFDPFFSTKPVGKGTGLGLSTCYGIIRQHEGDITCGNRLEGGAYFTIFVPAVAVGERESSVAAVIASGLARIALVLAPNFCSELLVRIFSSTVS